MDRSYSPTQMILSQDTHSYIKNILTRQSPRTLVIQHDVSCIDFPLKAHTIIIDYNITNHTQLIHLRRVLAQAHAHTIILNGHTNLIPYIREHTIEHGSGLFGATLRNEFIQKFIVQDIPSENEHALNMKYDLKKEQQMFTRYSITPVKKMKIRVYKSNFGY
jgi:hypothetical protein